MKKHLLILKNKNGPDKHMLILHNNRVNFQEAFQKVLETTKQVGFSGFIQQIPIQYWTAQGLCTIELEYTEWENTKIQSPELEIIHSQKEHTPSSSNKKKSNT